MHKCLIKPNCFSDGDEIFADTDSNETIQLPAHAAPNLALDYTVNAAEYLEEVNKSQMYFIVCFHC